MEKCAKLGMPVTILSMLCYFSGWYSFTACAVLFAVIIAFSDNENLKVNATQAIVFSAIITVITSIIGQFSGFVYDGIYWVAGIFNNAKAFGVSDGIYSFANWMNTFDILLLAKDIINYLYFIFTIVFVFGSLNGKVAKVPFATKIVTKAFDESTAE